MRGRSERARSDLFVIASEVAQALENQHPVVALESAALSRGFPKAMAIDVEQRIEEAVRKKGAIPALLFIRDGKIHVGGTQDDLSAIAGNREIERASRSNLVGVLDGPGYGVTTVSASMMICDAVGIKFLAVGGIGGVHRGAFHSLGDGGTSTLDVSSDLEELARTNVVVVASGAKSFLDLPATMQWLETRGVPVATFGGKTVPGYFSVESEEDSPIVVNTHAEGARLLRRHFALQTGTGFLYCVPVPSDAAIARDEIEHATQVANAEVAAKGVIGGPVTAAVLEVVARETKDRTLQAQVAMSIQNAAVAAELAAMLSGNPNS